MPRKKNNKIDSKIQEKLEYIGLDLNKIPKNLQEYTDVNFKILRAYDEKRYKQYRFIDINDIEIFLSPTNRVDSIKEKYEKAQPLCFYLDSENEENIETYTQFLKMLSKANIAKIEEIEEEQKKISRKIPFKIKYTGSYLWQIYYSEISEKYFMIFPIEDTDYSTFFYLLKKKIENKKQNKIFAPVGLLDFDGILLSKEEINDMENYLWLFTKDYPSIYEVWDKKGNVSLNIIGETYIYEKIKTTYKIKLDNEKDAIKFYKLLKAIFILQTELPHYFNFYTNINENAQLEFYIKKTKIEYENLPEFIMEQYLKSIGMKNKIKDEMQDLEEKLENLKQEAIILEKEYLTKEKQISTYLECKKTFLGRVKYFFKLGKKISQQEEPIKKIKQEKIIKEKQEKFKLEARNYTLFELKESFKELGKNEETLKKMIMDINALKLKNKNVKKKIQNATNYINEINKHRKSIFDFWKYSNKDAVSTLDEGEEKEINVSKLEKIFNFEDEFEDFGIKIDKKQREKLTDDEMDSVFIATTDLLDLIGKIHVNEVDNKQISEKLRQIKIERENGIPIEEEEESFNIFGRIQYVQNTEKTIGNKVHREVQRDKFEILEIKKGMKGLELKNKIDKIIQNIQTALQKNSLDVDTYVYFISSESTIRKTFQLVSLSAEKEVNDFLNKNQNIMKLYLYKIKLPKGTNFIALSNIIFYENKNMTLPVGMNLSYKILIDFSKLDFTREKEISVNKLQFEDEEDIFSEIIIKNIEIEELKLNGSEEDA